MDKKQLLIFLTTLFSCLTVSSQNGPCPVYSSIRPGQEWLDTNGRPIQAHGFSVVWSEQDECYYWFGEDKTYTTKGSNVWTYGIRCYSSKDFYNWEDRGHIMLPETKDVLSPIHYSQGMDRPHIIIKRPANGYAGSKTLR